MKNGKIRIISLVLLTVVVILSVFSLNSCAKDREYDEKIVLAEAERLIKESILLNEIYYGSGIPYNKDESYSDGAYYAADGIYLDSKGISTVDDIKNMTKRVYSKELSDAMARATFASVYEGEEIRVYSRYYQSYDSLTDEPVRIMVYSDANVLLKDKVEYDYTTLKATGSKKEIVYVEIKATVTNAKGESIVKTLSIGLIEEESGWRLATPTYTSYSDPDYYNDLQNKEL